MRNFLVILFGAVVVGVHALDRHAEIFISPQENVSENISAQPKLTPKLWDFETAEELRSEQLWIDDAQTKLKEKLKQSRQNRFIAKNVIFFLGDGMSPDTVTAARIFEGQRRGIIGERNRLSFEKFPYTGLSKTYCVDRQVADSACSATAYMSGVKANFFTIGVTANVSLTDCAGANDPQNQLSSIAAWALDAGKSAGIVTTTTVTHASPSGAYAHTPLRLFESDYDIKYYSPYLQMDEEATVECIDIARQLIEYNVPQKFSVILGGGTSKFLPNTTVDDKGHPGERMDNRNLIQEWLDSKTGKVASYVSGRAQLLNTNIEETDYLLGLFAPGNLDYNIDNIGSSDPQPSLTEMTESAIRMLSKNKKGYFLFVEGGRIDHGNHETKARKALDETIEFSKAIEKARTMTRSKDTLIVVTADHSHTLTINGYPELNNNIVGLQNSPLGNSDGLPYATLSYGNGPGVYNYFRATPTGEVERIDPTDMFDDADNDLYYPSVVPMDQETHGGGDVGIYASGPWDHLFSGVLEQSNLPHLMGYASCIGPGLRACKSNVAT